MCVCERGFVVVGLQLLLPSPVCTLQGTSSPGSPEWSQGTRACVVLWLFAQSSSLSPCFSSPAHPPPCAPACCLCQLTVSAPVFDSSVYIDPQPAPLFPFPELLHPMSGEEEEAGALGLSLHSGEGWGGDSLSCCWGSLCPSFRALHYDI